MPTAPSSQIHSVVNQLLEAGPTYCSVFRLVNGALMLIIDKGDHSANMEWWVDSQLASLKEKRAPVRSSDTTLDSKSPNIVGIMMDGLRTRLLIPLINQDELVGLVYLDARVGTKPLTDGDLEACVSIAAPLADLVATAQS